MPATGSKERMAASINSILLAKPLLPLRISLVADTAAELADSDVPATHATSRPYYGQEVVAPVSSNDAAPIPPFSCHPACGSSSRLQSDILSLQVAWGVLDTWVASRAAAAKPGSTATSLPESASSTALRLPAPPTVLGSESGSALPDSCFHGPVAPIPRAFTCPHRVSAPTVQSRSTDIAVCSGIGGSVRQSDIRLRPDI